MARRPTRRVVVVVVVGAIAAVAARVAAPAPRHVPASLMLRYACGVERWDIKTLKDRPVLLRAKPTTVAFLTSLPRPRPFPPPARLPLERQIYTVVASVTLDRSEVDLDHHLVLSAGGKRMIAETPSPVCTVGATVYRRKQMKNARAAARLCSKARVTGVAFFDYKHGQTGVAPNAIELHPVLGFACLTKGTPPPPPPPPGGKCAASYPTVCIPPPPPDLNCPDIPYRNFRLRWDVLNPDPHHFDGNHDGVGCES